MRLNQSANFRAALAFGMGPYMPQFFAHEIIRHRIFQDSSATFRWGNSLFVIAQRSYSLLDQFIGRLARLRDLKSVGTVLENIPSWKESS